jgi:hypothetical protein
MTVAFKRLATSTLRTHMPLPSSPRRRLCRSTAGGISCTLGRRPHATLVVVVVVVVVVFDARLTLVRLRLRLGL